VIDKENVGKLDTLGDQIDTAKAALTGLKNQAIVALIPLLTEMVTGFTEWVKTNRELIQSTLQRVVEGLVFALKALGATVVFVSEHWQAFAALLISATVINGIMAIIRVIVFFQAVQTRAALQAVINWMMILGPILLIAAAIVVLGILIYKYRDQVKAALIKVKDFFVDVGAKIRDFFVGIWDSIKNAADAVWTAIRDGFKAAFDFVVNLPVIKQLIELVQDIKDLATGKDKSVQAMKGTFGGDSNEMLSDSMSMPYDDYRKKYGLSDLGTGYQGAGGAATAQVPLRMGVGGPSGGASVSISPTYNVQIDAKNADAKEVGTIVDQRLKEHDEQTRRQTAASLGVK